MFDLKNLVLACQNSKDFDIEFLEQLQKDSDKHLYNNYTIYAQYIGSSPIGFCFIHTTVKGYRIEVLCSRKGYGKYLLNYIKDDLCKEHCFISLSSVKSAEEFYIKNGFTINGSEDDIDYDGYNHFYYLKY